MQVVKRVMRSLKYTSILGAKEQKDEKISVMIPGVGIIKYDDKTKSSTIDLEQDYQNFLHSIATDDPTKIRRMFLNFVKEPLA